MSGFLFNLRNKTYFLLNKNGRNMKIISVVNNRNIATPMKADPYNAETWRILNKSPVVKQTIKPANNRLYSVEKLIDFIRFLFIILLL